MARARDGCEVGVAARVAATAGSGSGRQEVGVKQNLCYCGEIKVFECR